MKDQVTENNSKPCVYLVGTGPGDPELLTVKALRLIKTADVIVYDRLVSDEILQLIPSGTTRIYVGKCSGRHTLAQSEINELLVRLAENERTIIRLKGGDPFVFGRGSEEALYLRKHNICFEVIPGITAASACTSYAGIPLTHRGLANTVQFISGHAQNNQALNLNWAGLVDESKTLVIYMGVATISRIANKLIEHGLPETTPAAAIEKGAGPQQRRFLCTLKELPEMVRKNALHAPVIFVIGKVATLAEELDWFTDANYVTNSDEDENAQPCSA